MAEAMGTWRATGLLLLCAAASSPDPARGCAMFGYQAQGNGNGIFGSLYGLTEKQKCLVLNRRGLRHHQIFPPAGSPPFTWTSRYGSVTLNRWGYGIPTLGLNERGLALQFLGGSGTVKWEYLRRVKGALDSQYVQYLLDTCATVQEVLAASESADPLVRGMHPLAGQLFAVDAGGDVVSIQHASAAGLAYKKYLRGASASAPAYYAGSYRIPEQHAPNFEAAEADPDPNPEIVEPINSDYAGMGVWYFQQAMKYEPARFGSLRDFAWQVHTASAKPSAETWARRNIERFILDPRTLRFEFSTRGEFTAHGRFKVKWINLSQLDFACEAQIKMLDWLLTPSLEGDLTALFAGSAFQPAFHDAMVSSMITKWYDETLGIQVPRDTLIAGFQQYVNTLSCNGAPALPSPPEANPNPLLLP